LYGFTYGLMRFVAEIWRQPDSQLGFLFGGWLTMGQLLSAMMMMVAVVLWFYFDNKLVKQKPSKKK